MTPLKLMFSKKKKTLNDTCTKHLRIQNIEIADQMVSFLEF